MYDHTNIDIDTLIHMIREQHKDIEALAVVVMEHDEEIERLRKRQCPCTMKFA